MSYYCYFITTFPNKQMKTYIGITNDLERRILQHNRIIKGGAKCTRMYSNWKYCLVLDHFQNKSDAGSFETQWKNMNDKKSGIGFKMCNLFTLLADPRWKNIKINFDY
ncbi:GIY-YIG nuclease [Klosneuvirus KNV1]|uniref:GIY-YIG nuclease n=1 Tax=Klosneuvirus KNV1 TaxID=1977640 RepID=A0A1V0SKI9_9VIRU|nr:GIY-YIG nuclease [Klosneuvirus KNV1]